MAVSLADLRVLAEQAREPLCDAFFRVRLLRQEISSDEMEQYVEVVESERRRFADALTALVDVAHAAQALSHFLNEEKTSAEPPRELLDEGWVSLVTIETYEREEHLGHTLAEALASLAGER